MPVTLKDIAKKTGYSITTVSRALAGYDDVAEATRQLVLETATQMGYHPDATARRLRLPAVEPYSSSAFAVSGGPSGYLIRSSISVQTSARYSGSST